MFILLEGLAVVLAIAYLLLAARQNLWCWACAFFSSLLYTYIFWDVSLLMESLLNVFYIVMAVLGWWQWSQKGGEKELQITSLKYWHHFVLIGLVISLALVNGWVMATYTSAAWPFLDSFTTWGAVITTIMVVRKVLENWLYWVVFDGISIYLYIDRELYQTAVLFAAYVIIVIFGYFSWKKQYLQQANAAINVK